MTTSTDNVPTPDTPAPEKETTSTPVAESTTAAPVEVPDANKPAAESAASAAAPAPPAPATEAVAAQDAEQGQTAVEAPASDAPPVTDPQQPPVTPSNSAPSSSVPTTPGANAQHSASLYVGDLHPDISEANLYEIFQALGPVQSIRVCRDVVTRRSLGYAYINFHNVTDAERALEAMNYYSSPLTKNKPLRMMWMIRDPSQRRTGAGNIFVKSLDKSIDNKSLYDTFSQFGNILSCKVAMDDNGQSLGHGFVHFETPEAAQAAIEKVNGKLLAGRKVYVGKFLNKREREAAGQVNKVFTNVFLKNIEDSHCSEEKLIELFQEFGDITSVHIAVSEDTKKPKGFAFVNFSSPEMAKRAVEGMNGKDVGGKQLYVSAAQKKAVREAELRNKYEMMRNERMQKYQGINLYIKNLSDDVDDDRLRQEFSPYGTITSCKIMRDDKGFSKGFGFVCYTTPDEATKAVTELNGRMVGQKPIYVALAQRKDVRRAQLEAQRQMNIRGIPPGAMPPGAAAMYAQPNPYMYQQPMANMAGVPQGMPAGRNGGYMNTPFVAQMGRGAVPAGRGGPAMPQYMTAMGRGQPAAMAPGMSPNMQMFGMAQQRQPRQNRQRGGHMGPGGPNAGMVPNRGAPAAGRGRGAPNGAAPAQQYKYTTNARNANMAAPNGQPQVPQPVPNGQPIPQQAGSDPGAVAAQPLTIEMLTNATPSQQKQMLGERLYPLIAEMQPRLSGKITGMLLDMENTEILHLLESPEALTERVDEAVAVLREHAAASGDQSQGQAQPQAV